MNRFGWAILLAVLFPLLGCKQERVRVYTVPKEQPSAPSPAARAHAGMTTPSVKWETPKNWEERPASGLRVADFEIPNPDGPSASVSIIPMQDVVDAHEDIVNLWRNQVGLKPASQTDLDATESVAIGTKQGELVDLVGKDEQFDGDPGRVLAAVLHEGQQSWFFKMYGPAKLVESQREIFRQFLKSVQFEAGVGTAPAMASGGVSPTTEGPVRPTWVVPEGWQETPPGNMTVARFVVGAEGVITVSSFPGSVGGLLANVNRWRGQLGLSPLSQLDDSVQRLDQAGAEAMLVEMTGQDTRGGGQPSSLLGAIVPRSEETWFYKFIGPPALVSQEKISFVSFVQSVDYSHGH